MKRTFYFDMKPYEMAFHNDTAIGSAGSVSSHIKRQHIIQSKSNLPADGLADLYYKEPTGRVPSEKIVPVCLFLHILATSKVIS